MPSAGPTTRPPRLPRALNPTARRFARRLVAEVPAFEAGLVAQEGGHFWAELPAPAGSRAGALVCYTCGDGEVWVRFAPPEAFYQVESEDELAEVVTSLLAEEALFVVMSGARGWAGTTLVAPGEPVKLRPGQRAEVHSWSGAHDARLGGGADPAGKRAARPKRARRP